VPLSHFGYQFVQRGLRNSGWSGSAQTDAAAKAGEKGAAYSRAVEAAPGGWVYQITKNGSLCS
jgi:hypothetical protein